MQYCSTHSYEIKGLRIYNTSNQELQQSSLVPISSILRLHGSTPSQTNCPAAAGCSEAFYQSFPARPGSLCRQARGESRLPRGESSPGISNDVVFGIFSPENAKNDVVRNSWARSPPSVLTTSFLAFSGLKMPKTTSLEIPGLDSPLSSLDSPDWPAVFCDFPASQEETGEEAPFNSPQQDNYLTLAKRCHR